MLINLRNALMAGKRLPYDAEVEYLESTGTQWIDTGLVWNRALTVSATVAGLQSTTFPLQVFFGARNLNAANAGYSFGFSSRNKFVSDNSGSRATSSMTYVQGDVYTVVKNLSGCSITNAAGTTENLVNNAGTQTATYNLVLFAQNNVGDVIVTKSRFYACKIYDANDTLVRDYIPVRKGTVGYLYDRVARKLFGNAGTGDFVLGPDVVPVEYIESHGTEYINTGIVPAANDSFYCRVKQSVDRDQCFWGLAGVAYCFSNGTSTGNGTYWGHPAIGTGGAAGVNPLGSTDWKEILCQSSGIFVDGVQINTQVTAPAQSPLNTVALFARAVNSSGGGVAKGGQGRMSEFRVERNGDPLRKYLPVRVGTDATSWEGAMMDVLTRRIYRNAGTGAFSYGNDLKYPIPAA